LTTVYGIVRDHGGWIEVYSQPDEGAKFTVYFPSVEGLAAVSEEATETRAGGGERILLVEDEASVRRVVRAILRHGGYDVVEASDGEEALRHVREQGTFALVLLDLSMPTMSGGEVLQRLRGLTPDLPVIIFTGQGVRLDQFPGATAVLTKPVKQHELLSAVARGLLDPE
jgi:CheY-like chemotaxis protein